MCKWILLVIGIGIGAALPAAASSDNTQVVATFDRLVAHGLPAVVELARNQPGRRQRRDIAATATSTILTVETELPVRVQFNDGPAGTMYRAMLNGRAAVITRSGQRLDITQLVDERVETTAYTDGAATPTHRTIHDGPSHDGMDASRPLPRQARAVDPAGPRDVDIHIFVHHDVDAFLTREEVHAGYVAWWLADAATSVMPFARFDIRYSPPVDGMTNMPYMHDRALVDWTHVVRQRADDEDFDASHLRKYLLVTLHEPAPGMGGIAWQGGNAAIASIAARYRIMAHELGHLFGATHKAAEVRFRGNWWCESNMLATGSAFRSNCYRYSAENERRMRRYAIEAPGSDWDPHRGPPVMN